MESSIIDLGITEDEFWLLTFAQHEILTKRKIKENKDEWLKYKYIAYTIMVNNPHIEKHHKCSFEEFITNNERVVEMQFTNEDYELARKRWGL
jgi:hypothetical protein